MVSKKELLALVLLWAVLTAAGIAVVSKVAFFPLAAATEAVIVDEAFTTLMLLAVPVFMFVLVALVFSAIRFRRRQGQDPDGPPIHTHGPTIATWVVATTALTVLVIIYPGATGMAKLHSLSMETPDLVVQIQGTRWLWKATYPDYGITSFNELVLPADRHVRFDVTATDVLHSFWIPAFRVKIDAVPGLVTTVHAKPDRTGSRQDDLGFRIVCAELCGTGHSIMSVPVRVLEPSAFQAWVAERTPKR